MRRRLHFRRLRSERGDSLLETAIVLPFLLLLLLGVVEFGQVYYLSIELAGAAQAGAIYGTQYPTDTTDMQTAALNNANDISGATATASYGCECPDGSGRSANCASAPSCSTNVVYYVNVKVSATYKPFFSLPGLPSTIPLSSTAVMRSGAD